MWLNTEDIDSLSEIVEKDALDNESLWEIEGMSLAAALELACFEWQHYHISAKTGSLMKWVSEWKRICPFLKQAHSKLRAVGLPRWSDEFRLSTPAWEIVPVPLPAQVDLEWEEFLMRFSRSLLSHGFGKSLSRALPRALSEMNDNVMRHANQSNRQHTPAVIGYHVEEGRMTFAVADVGRGVLNSLRQNAKWENTLSNHVEALNAAVLQRATSNAIAQHGDGFQQVHVALADIQGQLRFRSGDGLLFADGRGAQRCFDSSYRSTLAQGLRLSVQCSLDTCSLPPEFL